MTICDDDDDGSVTKLGRGEQLYLFEVSIETVCVENHDGPFRVKVKFLDFPLFIIDQRDRKLLGRNFSIDGEPAITEKI